jgi:lysophospholipase L1-like esterase
MKDLSVMKQVIQKDYERHREKFKGLTSKHKIILLGDSMIAYLPMRFFGIEEIVLNLGIPGDTTIGVLNRLDDVTRLEPTRVILNIGSNDLVLTDLSLDQTVSNIMMIRETLESKGIPVTIVSMTPVLTGHVLSNMDYIRNRTNAELSYINTRLSLLLPMDAYVDVYPSLLEEQQLKPSYTTDGIHLSKEGYAIYLSKLNLI